MDELHKSSDPGPAAEARVRDPVCGMMVDPATALSAEHGGKTYHFCCEGCRDSFASDPEKYLSAKPFVLPPRAPMAHGHHEQAHHDHIHHHEASAPVKAAAGATYTCPMHPQIVRDGPGFCPICGMALEPVMPSRDEGPNPELVDFTR